MQGYWNHHLRLQPISFSAHHFSQPLLKPRPQRLDLLEFQKENRPHHRILIHRKASRPVKGIRSVLASRAAQQLLRVLLRQSRQGSLANLAYYDVGHPFKGREALLAKRNPARARQQPLGDSASRREKNADDRAADLREPAPPGPGPAAHTPRALPPLCRWMNFRHPRKQNSTLL